MAAYYAEYARGGFGLIISEGTYTDDAHSQAYPNQPAIVTDAQARAWARSVPTAFVACHLSIPLPGMTGVVSFRRAFGVLGPLPSLLLSPSWKEASQLG